LVGVTEIFPGLGCSWYSSAARFRSAISALGRHAGARRVGEEPIIVAALSCRPRCAPVPGHVRNGRDEAEDGSYYSQTDANEQIMSLLRKND